MRIRKLVAGLTSLSVGISAIAYGGPTVLAAGRFAAATAGLDPVTALAVVRASSPEDLRADLAAAVAADDADLAESLLALAAAREIAIPVELSQAVADMNRPIAVAMRGAADFGSGVWTGSADGMMGLAGVAASDLLVIGDLRDLAGETTAWWRGEEPDWLIVGLATVGIGLTASTVASGVSTIASGGATAPVTGAAAAARGGLSAMKMVLKTPAVVSKAGSELVTARGLRAMVKPMLDDAVDPSALRRAVASLDITDPGKSVRVAREAVDWRRVGRLTAVATDFERVRSAGVRTALWLGRTIETPADLARGTARLEKLGAKALALTSRLGSRLVRGVWSLLGFVWDIVAAIAGAVIGVLHGLAGLLKGLWRIRRAFA